MKLLRIDSIAQLRQCVDAWDDLWLRSDATLPTLRADSLALWLEQFAARRPLALLAVEHEGSFVAALPLVGGRMKGLAVGSLPRNCWTGAGDLLVDRQADGAAALAHLVEGIRRLPWNVISADGVDLSTPAWQELLRMLQQRGHRCTVRPKYHVGLIDTCGEWEAYEAAWSGNHRRSIRRSLSRLQARGEVVFQRFDNPSPAEARALLRRVCELEDLSWKGSAGTSIQRTAGMLQFYSRQAELMAQTGNVELLFLVQDDTTIAADYGFFAKGVHHSHKIAFHPQYREFGPGHLLCREQLRAYFADPESRVVDTLGILTEANARWATRVYTVSRAMIDTGGLVGRSVVWSYEHAWPVVRRWMGRSDEVPGLSTPRAAGFLASTSAPEPCEAGA